MKSVCVCLGGRQRKYTIQIMIEKAENGIKTVDLLNTWFGHMKFINDRHHIDQKHYLIHNLNFKFQDSKFAFEIN